MTTNHTVPTTHRRRSDHVRSTMKGAPGAIRLLFAPADRCGRAPAGPLAAKQIVLARVKMSLYTDNQDA